MQVAALTCEEACQVLLKTAKDFLGPQLVDQICHVLVHVFLFKTTQPRTGAQLYARIKTPESFLPVNVTTDRVCIATDEVYLSVPGLPSDQLAIMLGDYNLLFVFEMEKRGFTFRSRWSDRYILSKK